MFSKNNVDGLLIHLCKLPDLPEQIITTSGLLVLKKLSTFSLLSNSNCFLVFMSRLL